MGRVTFTCCRDGETCRQSHSTERGAEACFQLGRQLVGNAHRRLLASVAVDLLVRHWLGVAKVLFDSTLVHSLGLRGYTAFAVTYAVALSAACVEPSLIPPKLKSRPIVPMRTGSTKGSGANRARRAGAADVGTFRSERRAVAKRLATLPSTCFQLASPAIRTSF